MTSHYFHIHRREKVMQLGFAIILIIFTLSSAQHDDDDDTFFCKRSKGDDAGGHGQSGAKGEKGEKGDTGDINSEPVFRSCKDVKRLVRGATNGLYTITDDKGSVYRTYCDLTIAGGGWTLVASVHENFLGGKCTTGDRWSSEQGNNAAHPHGDGAWENTKTFGRAESAASDDYKNPGYFNMEAADVMIWHVPNNALAEEFSSRAHMMYHTTSGFLPNYGGNLFKLFRDRYPLRDRVYHLSDGNGPAEPIVWDRGNSETMVANTPPNNRVETIPGFVQFRAINHERGAFALCPGLKIRPTMGNVEHVCIGGTSNHGESHKHCGDFASKDWNGYATGVGWSSNRVMTESVVMIFYR